MNKQNELAISPQQAIASLQQQDTPEARAVLGYIKALETKNVAVLGTDEAFILKDDNGQIKAFKRMLTLSAQAGTLIQPLKNSPFVISAQGYEVWAEATGTSVIFPKTVIVGNEAKSNPYAERSETTNRVVAVYARAIAFRYSSMGIPQVSDWTTIYDVDAYRMQDLLGKAKKLPQAFKVLPKDIIPKNENNATWAHYPFDDSMNLWINTSHQEVLTWLAQIINREKKALDFAQTFAKRNALKHLSGIQKSPGPQWPLPVLAWRPTGNNIVKWDSTQYANLQDRVSAMVDGDESSFDNQPKIELKTGTERTSDDKSFTEEEVDPEDTQEADSPNPDETPPVVEPSVVDTPKKTAEEVSKNIKQALYLQKQFSEEFKRAAEQCEMNTPPESWSDLDAIRVCRKVSEILDLDNK